MRILHFQMQNLIQSRVALSEICKLKNHVTKNNKKVLLASLHNKLDGLGGHFIAHSSL